MATLEPDERDGVPLLVLEDAPAGFRVAFTTRRGGVSGGRYESLNLGARSGDRHAAVVENRRRALGALGGDPARTSGLHQWHSTDVVHLATLPSGAFLDPALSPPRGDVLVTGLANVPVVALGADCLTVALLSPASGRVAVAHAGWRGLAAGVLEAAVEATGPDVLAVVGPGAGACCYEVRDDAGDPLRERFGPDAVREGRADLALCAERALREGGASDVVQARRCTICAPDEFHSYRRDGARGGLQGVIALRTEAA